MQITLDLYRILMYRLEPGLERNFSNLKSNSKIKKIRGVMARERKKTDYPGIFYREVPRIGGTGPERVYYALFKRDGKTVEAKVGYQYRDKITPAYASRVRSDLIEGRRLTRKEIRQVEKEAKEADLSRWTVDRLWSEYLSMRSNLKGRATDENRFNNYIRPSFGDKELFQILPLDVSRLEKKLLKTLSAQTTWHVLELLRRLSNFAVKMNLCPGLPFKIQMPRVNNVTTEDLTPQQMRDLLAVLHDNQGTDAADAMLLALFTGMRRGEMFRLKWNDVDVERGFIRLRDPKGGVDSSIPLNDAARKLLEDHPRGSSEFIFPGKGGGQRVCIKRSVNELKEKAGIPKNFRALHGLRHVFASMLASSGKVDLFTLQKLLTHKSPTPTMRYSHLRDAALRDASNLAGRIISDAGDTDEKKVVDLNKSSK